MSQYRRTTDEFYRRERRPPPRSNRMLLVGLAVFGMATVILVAVVGRPFLYMREASVFMTKIDDLPPAEVKQRLLVLSRGLQDRNALVRQTAVGALRVATRKDLGNNPEVWRVWWRENQATWEYQRPEPKAE